MATNGVPTGYRRGSRLSGVGSFVRRCFFGRLELVDVALVELVRAVFVDFYYVGVSGECVFGHGVRQVSVLPARVHQVYLVAVA